MHGILFLQVNPMDGFSSVQVVSQGLEVQMGSEVHRQPLPCSDTNLATHLLSGASDSS